MGKSTISMAIFNSKLLVITRGLCLISPCADWCSRNRKMRDGGCMEAQRWAPNWGDRIWSDHWLMGNEESQRNNAVLWCFFTWPLPVFQRKSWTIFRSEPQCVAGEPELRCKNVSVEPFHRPNWQITEIGWVLRPNIRARDELPYPLEVKIEWPLIHPIFQWIDLREKFEEDHGLIPPNLLRFVKICRINSGLAGFKYVPCSTTFGYIWHIFADWWFETFFTCPQKLGIINWLSYFSEG